MVTYWVIFSLTSCGTPSQQSIQTAIAQTQSANPTSTFTLIPSTLTPTEAPTNTSTIAPSSTPDLLLLQVKLKDFLLQQTEIPLDDKYTPIYKTAKSIPNEGMDLSLVQKTGRIDGWQALFGKGYSAPWYGTISDEISLYKTSEGAQLAIAMFMLSGYTEEINQPKIGEITRSFYQELTNSDGNNQMIYTVIFSYRNCVHVVEGFGYEKNGVKEYTRIIAQNLLAKLQASSLLNP
jgi:hypothetical protein